MAELPNWDPTFDIFSKLVPNGLFIWTPETSPIFLNKGIVGEESVLQINDALRKLLGSWYFTQSSDAPYFGKKHFFFNPTLTNKHKIYAKSARSTDFKPKMIYYPDVGTAEWSAHWGWSHANIFSPLGMLRTYELLGLGTQAKSKTLSKTCHWPAEYSVKVAPNHAPKWEKFPPLSLDFGGADYVEGQLLKKRTEIAEKMIEFNNPLPHSHLAYVDSDLQGTQNGFTITTLIMKGYEDLLSTEPYAKIVGWEDHSHEIINGKMMPAGYPLHIHLNEDSGGNFSYDVDGPGPLASEQKNIYEAFEPWPRKLWESVESLTQEELAPGVFQLRYGTKINEPLFLEFVWLMMNNKTLEDIIGPLSKHGPMQQVEGFLKSAQAKMKGTALMLKKPWNLGQYEMHSSGFQTHTKNYNKYFDNACQIHKPAEYTNSLKMQFNWVKPYYEEALTKIPYIGVMPNLYLHILQEIDPDMFINKDMMIGKIPYTPTYGDIMSMGSSPYITSLAPGGGIDHYLDSWSKSAVEGHFPSAKNIEKTQRMVFPSTTALLNKYVDQEYVFPWASELSLATAQKVDASIFTNPKGKYSFSLFENDEAMHRVFSLWLMRWVLDYTVAEGGGTEDADGVKQTGPLDMAATEAFYIKSEADNHLTDIQTRDLSSLINASLVDPQFLPDSESLSKIEKLVNKLEIKNGLTMDELGQLTEAVATGPWAVEYFLEAYLVSMLKKLYQYLSMPTGTELHVGKGLKNHQRGYGLRCLSEILNGELSFAEVVFYEIVKLEVQTVPFQQRIIQKFYIAAPWEEGFINFIDTQLQYNESYTYRVYAHVLNIGNEYHYVDCKPMPLPFKDKVYTNSNEISSIKRTIDVETEVIQDIEIEKPVALMTAVNKPSIKLMRVPYTGFGTIHVSDAPPIEPIVEISPYKNVNNKLLFWFSESVGSYEAPPIMILPGDKEIFRKAAAAASGIDKSAVAGMFGKEIQLPETIKFRSDSPVKSYQIFRVDKKPTFYSDFANGLYRTLGQGQTDFVETFIPNKKYYYAFRTEDYHGFVSNPTVIYEVEIVEDSGAVYPIIKVVDMSPKQQKTKTKLARKYLHVVPTFKQSMPTVDNKTLTSANNANPLFGNVFGTENNPQRFKIRVTSKSSGKKFDLNVNFIHKHEGSLAEQEKWVFEKEMEGIVDKSMAKQEKATKETIKKIFTLGELGETAMALIKYAKEKDEKDEEDN